MAKRTPTAKPTTKGSTHKPTKSKLTSVSKPSTSTATASASTLKANKHIKTKRNNESLIDHLDSELPDILQLASKMKQQKPVSFGILEKPRAKGPTKKQKEAIQMEEDLDAAMGMIGAL
ncbi:hypothetical protein HDU98_008610 [Podochytrium sp. JEL0797]|nr:hypothetical protein HDU98_008610 [Podochytrium sp. JEL0797]